MLTTASVLLDRSAARFADVAAQHGVAFARIVDIVDSAEERLTTAERAGRPALQGVVHELEDDLVLGPLLVDAVVSVRLRQVTGVIVRIKMEELGWSPSGRKGVITGAVHFGRAERYEPPAGSERDAARERALAALDRIGTIGDAEEQAASLDVLMAALAATRTAEGRPF